MAILVVPVLVALLGALVYALSANPKAAELGRLAYFVGLMWSVYIVAHDVVHVL